METQEKKETSAGAKVITPIIEQGGENEKEVIPNTPAVIKSTADIDGFIEQRKQFIEKVSAICVEGKDYHVIQGKKSLAKGGAEKIASIFQWNATFEKDDQALEMLGEISGLVAFKCTMRKGTKYVGEGRGAALLSKNADDPNKTLKMAQKSAFIDAVLRASGLSDFFTQDLEDMPAGEIGQPHAQSTTTSHFEAPSEKQMDTIQKIKQQKGYTSNEIVMALKIDTSVPFSKKSASLVIDWLMKAPTKQVQTAGGWDNVGDPNA